MSSHLVRPVVQKRIKWSKKQQILRLKKLEPAVLVFLQLLIEAVTRPFSTRCNVLPNECEQYHIKPAQLPVTSSVNDISRHIRLSAQKCLKTAQNEDIG